MIDHGKVIAEGTPGQLKASVGSGALHVRLLDPEQRPEAEQLLERELGAVQLEPDPAALSVPCADADRAAEAVAELARSGVRIADFSLGQPSLDEVFLALTGHPAEERGRAGNDDRGGAGSMSANPTTEPAPRPAAEEAALRKALSSTPRPPARERRSRRPSPSAGEGCSRSSTSPSSCST